VDNSESAKGTRTVGSRRHKLDSARDFTEFAFPNALLRLMIADATRETIE
jgi:hypothetical protein